MSGSYPVPPPSYRASGSTPKPARNVELDDQEPLLGGGARPASPGGIYEQPAPGELPDDFKVRFMRRVKLLPCADLTTSMVCLYRSVWSTFAQHSCARCTPSFVSLSLACCAVHCLRMIRTSLSNRKFFAFHFNVSLMTESFGSSLPALSVVWFLNLPMRFPGFNNSTLFFLIEYMLFDVAKKCVVYLRPDVRHLHCRLPFMVEAP